MLSLRTIVGNISKGQSAISTRIILNNLEEFYQSIRQVIEIKGCQKTDNNTTVYMLMPSMKTAGIMYDIVLLAEAVTGKINLDTKFKVYSNSPGFGYNFTYVFHHAGSLLFPNKYPGPFVQTAPKMRNPFLSFGFDKHVFSAFRFLSNHNLDAIIENFDGRVPAIKSFEQKQSEITTTRQELERAGDSPNSP